MKNVKHIARSIYRFLILWFVDTISLMGTAVILPGITIQSSGSYPAISVAASAALLLGIINFLIRPLILLLAVPFGMIFVFLIGFFANAIALVLTSNLMSPAFQVDGWLTAFIGGLIFSAINTIITGLMTVDDQGSFYQGLVERLAKRKMFPNAETDERGLVMMEIDGLSYHHIQKAIEDGWMPNLSEMIENDGYVISRVDCGLPSQTSACQSGIMFGDNSDIPAFRWFDKDLNRMVVSSHDAAMI
ncbi:MAG: phage holin family protein, partial [Anaerolineales bacterium]